MISNYPFNLLENRHKYSREEQLEDIVEFVTCIWYTDSGIRPSNRIQEALEELAKVRFDLPRHDSRQLDFGF